MQRGWAEAWNGVIDRGNEILTRAGIDDFVQLLGVKAATNANIDSFSRCKSRKRREVVVEDLCLKARS